MPKILITGSQGFIGTYLCAEFLKQGYKVIGVDNFSKYGPVSRPHDTNPNFHLLEMDVRDFNTKVNPSCIPGSRLYYRMCCDDWRHQLFSQVCV